MSKVIFALFAICAIASAASFRATLADNELLVPSNGQVSLTYVPNAGYVLPVDLARNARASQQMVVSLYSSNVLFPKSCFQFKSYPCSQFDFCAVDNSKTVSYTYPYFTAQGNLLKTQLYADYSSWALAVDAPAFLATACSAPTTEAFGTNSVGLLGLGVDGTSQKNFLNMVNSFSVFYNQGFKLVFNPQINFPHEVRAKLATDGNWRVPNIAQFKFGTDVNPLTGVSAIFDINSDSISLPVPLYTAFVQLLNKYGAQCPPVYTTPICNYSGQTKFLPNIEFIVDGQTKIEITPQMYALNPANNQFKLNLKGISPQMTGLNYVTQPYQYTIVLGSSVLGGYYTVFNTAQRTVSLLRVL